MTDNAKPASAGTSETAGSPVDCTPGVECYTTFHERWHKVKYELPDGPTAEYNIAKTFWAWAWEESRKQLTANVGVQPEPRQRR